MILNLWSLFTWASLEMLKPAVTLCKDTVTRSIDKQAVATKIAVLGILLSDMCRTANRRRLHKEETITICQKIYNQRTHCDAYVSRYKIWKYEIVATTFSVSAVVLNTSLNAFNVSDLTKVVLLLSYMWGLTEHSTIMASVNTLQKNDNTRHYLHAFYRKK